MSTHLQRALAFGERPRLLDQRTADPLPAEGLGDVQFVQEDARVTVDAEQDVGVREPGRLPVDLRAPHVHVVTLQQTRRLLAGRHALLEAAA